MSARPFVVCLECRTSTSGLAYSALGGPIITHQVYPGASTLTPYNITDMLYQCKAGGFGAPKAWGWSARLKYSIMQPEERMQHTLVVGFKPELEHLVCNDGQVSHQIPELPFAKLVSDYLRKLSSLAKGTLKRRWPNMTDDQIMWVITVPTEWSAPAELGIRKAAIQAGIIPSLCSDAIWLLPEMEAISLYARKPTAIKLVYGTTVAVIDAGETHSSISMRMAERKGSRIILGKATHRMLLTIKSKTIDQKFEVIMAKRLGNAWAEWKNKDNSTSSYKDFMRYVWHDTKMSFDNTSIHANKYCGLLELPTVLVEKLMNSTKRWLESHAGDSKHFPLSTAAVLEIIDPVVTKIIAKAQQLMGKARKVPSHVLLMGNFGSMPYMESKIRSAFPYAAVVLPDQTYSVILQGGVMFGKDLQAKLASDGWCIDTQEF